MVPILTTLFYTFAFLNSTSYDEYRALPFKDSYYGLPYCIVKLQLEDTIYNLFDFTYPPLIMETTQEQTNYAFIMIKYFYMHDIVRCIKETDPEVYDNNKTELRYDKMHLEFTGYLSRGLHHHYDVDLMDYPMFESYFKSTFEMLNQLSKLHIETRPVFPLGNVWKRAYYFYLEQWHAYLRKYY